MAREFYTPQTLERLAGDLLQRYVRKTGQPLSQPISAEHMLDGALADELKSPLWTAIPEPENRTVLAGLAPAHRLIVLNQSRQQLILETAGLLNTILAHEIAHWILHVDRARIGQPPLFAVGWDLQYICDRGDTSSWDEKNANRFMSYLLMPHHLIVPCATSVDLTRWANLYRLREEFDVTITALRIRLQELGLLHVDQQGTLYPSRAEAEGQRRLLL